MEKLLEYLNAERGRRLMMATQLGIFPSAISQWKAVPADRVLEVERMTGISRHELRPDVFGSASAEPDMDIEDKARAETDREKVA